MQPIKNILIMILVSSKMMAFKPIIVSEKDSILVCYGKLDPATIKGNNYVILEDKNNSKTDITTIKKNNKKVLAYISLGEVNKYADHYEALKNSFLGKNKIWNSYYLDLKSSKTVSVLLDIISKLFDKGYDGLFLDNIDNFSTFGMQKNQKTDLLAFLLKMKTAYPDKEFMQNAGLDLIAETHQFINSLAIESIASDYRFENKKYQLREINQCNEGLARLQSINSTYSLPIILIEYADSTSLYEQIQARVAHTNFDIFIGNIDLQKLPILKQK